MDAVLGPRLGVEQAVGVEKEILDAEFLQQAVDAGLVAALRQPDAARAAPEDARMRAHRHGQLGIEAFLVHREQRQIAVGGAAGEDVELARLQEPAERACHVEPVLLDEAPAQARVQVAVELHHRQKIRVVAGAGALARERLEPLVEVAHVAAGEQRIGHHRQQRRRERHRHAERNAVARELLEDVEQRQIGFGERLEVPVLFEEAVVLRVAHERQVRVQDEREVTFGVHGSGGRFL